ncbi:MAG: tRNA uridine-5-carboxymethylaminomethyl(34) synthesis GTPase MnmE [Pseudomonadota bacterium]|nr:tRNA uridine-5-carboxymethylaminomethyl(34) synthesis GTPase MnmE [Pseudomonadota bacterium]
MVDSDTIVAVATPNGRGGIGIVRLSGRDALQIGETLAGRVLPARRAVHCVFRDSSGESLDDGIAIAYHAPSSFTGEHVVEFQGHGGPAVLGRVVAACLAVGARPARPGEFSERAFLNDRLDLAQAEAIADLIAAASEEAARAALRTLQGAFSEAVHAVMDETTALRAYVEAAIDFPDEDVDFLADGEVAHRLAVLVDHLARVQMEARRGVALSEGLSVVLAGAPNAGKSSLLNQLVRKDAAIVTDIPGTTRDVLREHITLEGIPFQITDTAGIRKTRNAIEAEGVRRALREIGENDVLIYLIDALESSHEAESRDTLEIAFGQSLPPHTIIVRNKIDLVDEAPSVFRRGDLDVVSLCALDGSGLEGLGEVLRRIAGLGGGQRSDYSARTRHLVALADAEHAFASASLALAQTGSGELVAEDLRRAHDALGAIVGEVTPDALLGEIFGQFCIGK